MNLKPLSKFLSVFLMFALMTLPGKMGMGQGINDWREFGSFGTGVGQFVGLRGVAVDSKGQLFVSDSDNDRIQMRDVNGVWSVIAGIGHDVGQVRFPMAITIDSNDELWVADFYNCRIQHRDINGRWESIGGPGVGPGKFGGPWSLKFDKQGQLWVTDYLRDNVQKRDSQGVWTIIGESGTGLGQFFRPTDLAISPNGSLIVADSQNDRIQSLSKSGIWSIVATSGGQVGQVKLPIGTTFDSAGSLWITDGLNDRLQKYDINGNWSEIGSRGTGAGQFVMPHQLTVATNGRIYVADFGNGRVASFVPDNPDQTPPASTFTPTPSATWSNTDVSASITATDNTGGSGVKEVHYSVNMGTEQIVTGSSATFTLSENGIHSIAYYAIDNAGNTETTQYATVKIDKTRPTVDAYAIGSIVTVIAQDTFSGVASTKVSVDGAAAVDYTGSFTVAPGAHTVTYWATDQAGNESTREVILVGVSVSTVTIAPTTLFSTKAGVGTVKLSLAAPAGGVVVMLDSNSAAVTVPVSVTVPAGALTATFPVTANTVSTDTKAVITASVGGQEVHGTVYVLVPFPKTLSVAPTTIIGGDAAVATVTLASSAGVGGQLVNLASSNANVVVPSTVTVPAGALSATFPVQTSIVNSDLAVAISADADGTGITTTVLVKRVAPKSITFAPASVVGGNSSVATLTVTKPAPAGGIVVDLRSVSSNVSVPATVSIPEGATTATFPVTTVPVKKSESAMIQAFAAGVKVSANITVTATSVVTVTLNPATVVGGLNSTGTITLNGNAPTGGTTVQLYSTNAAAGVPSSVVVPGGSKTVSFPITTVPVATNTATTIAAKYLGTIKSAALTVAAPTVNTLTLSPSSLTGGATSKLTIKLTGKAATGGVVVTLTSSNTVVAQLPASVTIPAGSDTVDVTITTAAVAATTNVTLTAKTGTVSKTAVLTVNK